MTGNSQPVPSSKSATQFRRFIIVGCSNFAVSFAVFYVFYNHLQLSGIFFNILGSAGEYLETFIKDLGAQSLNASLANIVGYSVGILNSFTWNKFWTFEARHQTRAQFLRFLVLNLSCLLLSSLSLFIFTDYLGFPYGPVWFIAMSIVTIINFAVSKYWVFVNP
jgi:putative flippase GtrA